MDINLKKIMPSYLDLFQSSVCCTQSLRSITCILCWCALRWQIWFQCVCSTKQRFWWPRMWRYIFMLHITKYTQLTCILFIFNPGSVFFHSVYTESFYTALTFAGIHTYYKYHDRYAMGILLSAVLFSLSTLIRSTGVLYIVVSGFPILRSAQQDVEIYVMYSYAHSGSDHFSRG